MTGWSGRMVSEDIYRTHPKEPVLDDGFLARMDRKLFKFLFNEEKIRPTDGLDKVLIIMMLLSGAATVAALLTAIFTGFTVTVTHN